MSARRAGATRRRAAAPRAVPYFNDEQEVYQHLGALFLDLLDDAELAPQFRKANTIVQYVYRNPDVADHRQAARGRGGAGRPRADRARARGRDDDGRRRRAPLLARQGQRRRSRSPAGQIKTKGPVAKVLKLVPLVKPVFPRYRAQLEAAGRSDLARRVTWRSAARWPPDGGLQGLLPVHRADAGDRRARPARHRPASSSPRRARVACSSSPTPAIRETGLVDRVSRASPTAALGPPAVFDEVPPTPTRGAVAAIAELAREPGADSFLALGGGSVIDSAKVGERPLHPRRRAARLGGLLRPAARAATAPARRSRWRRSPRSRRRPAPARRSASPR